MSIFKKAKLTRHEFDEKYKYGKTNQKCCGTCRYYIPWYNEGGNCNHPEIEEDEAFAHTNPDMLCRAWKRSK